MNDIFDFIFDFWVAPVAAARYIVNTGAVTA